ncbi:MAG: hypothetical protein HFI76_03995 [Lachnospiraceae bacterium]|nr:hypothetical protein [Lachnospiraceae bacterium]
MGVDFSREIFFRHTIVEQFSGCVVFYAQPHAEEVCRRSGAWGARRAGEDGSSLLNFYFKENTYGSNVYERKKGAAFGVIYVSAYGAFHGGELFVQYR